MGVAKVLNIALLFLLISSSTFAYDDSVIKMSIDYFSHRNVKLVCILCCEDKKWTFKFTKNAFTLSVVISQPNPGKRPIQTDLDICLRHKFTPIGILINAECVNFEDVLYLASQNTYFDALHKWLIVENKKGAHTTIKESNINEVFINITNASEPATLNDEDFIESARILKNLNISVDADITVAKEKGKHSFKYRIALEKNPHIIEDDEIYFCGFDYDLYETFNFGKKQGGHLIVKKMGTWNHNEGLKADFNSYKYYRRWDFKQLSMRLIAVIASPPKIFYPEMLTDNPPAPGVSDVTQTSTTILNEIVEMHKIRFVYTITDRWMGDFSKNSSKVAASSLHFRTQDITPVLRLMPDTHQWLDLAHPPVTSIQTRYYYRIPTEGPGKFENKFFEPLSREVWGYVLLVMLLSVALLMLSAKFEQRPSFVQYAVFSVTALFCQQFFVDISDGQIRKSFAGRKLSLLVTGVSCLLIFNYYTSSAVSWLLSGPPPSINSLEELLDSPLELIYEDIGYTRSWLQTPNYYFNRRNAEVEDKTRKKILNRKKLFNRKIDNLLFSLEDGIKMMQTGGYAFHIEVNSANRLISRSFMQSELCELGSVQSMEESKLFVSLQKHSPFKEFFVWSLARLSERGIISCIQRRTAAPSVKCEGSSPRALALGGAAPAFLFLAGGYVLGTCIMFLERLYKMRENAKVSKKKLKNPQRLRLT